MGGAFIGVADSIETVYWNPAGLDQNKKRDHSLYYDLKPGGSIGYRSFFAINRNSTLPLWGFLILHIRFGA